MSVDSAVDQRRSKHWGQYVLLAIAIILMLIAAAIFGETIPAKYIW